MSRPTAAAVRRAAPYTTLALAIAALLVIPASQGTELGVHNVFNIGQHFATYGVLALALGLLMIAGEFDLSVAAVFAVGAMVAVKTGVSSPLLGAVAALATGVLVGALQGGLVAGFGLASMSVTVGGYIALLGLTRVIGGDQSVGYTNYDVGDLLETSLLGGLLSLRALAVIALFCLAGWLLRCTRWGRDLRAVGRDRRAARVAGVRVVPLLVGLFAAAGGAVALAGASVGYSLASASADLASINTLVYAATAALLGGVALSGGVGTVCGIAAGALSLSVLQETLSAAAAPAYASELVTGGLLLLASALAAPSLPRLRLPRRRRAATDPSTHHPLHQP